MSAFLDKKQLCERWEISYTTLEKRIHDGWIKPVKPNSTYFSLAAIEAVERAGLDEEQLKPLLMAHMRKKNEQLQKENEELRGVIGRMLSMGLPYFNCVTAKSDVGT